MPAIKVYKANGKMVPVSEAKVSKAYQCPWTAKVFATKSAYTKHLRELRENRMHRRAREIIRKNKLTNLIEQPSFSDIIKWIEMNPEFFFDGIIKEGHTGWANRRAHIRDEFWIKINELTLRYDDCVSNSHNSPRGKPRNWDRNKDKPMGYPGWTGRIQFTVSHDIGFGSNVVEQVGICTGSGGGSRTQNKGMIYSYECKMFLDDWPGLRSTFIADKLAGYPPANCSYNTVHKKKAYY